MVPRLLHFSAVVLTGLALVPAGAHFFSLPHKMALTMDQYFLVQGIYRGWAMFGIVLIGAMLANAALAIALLRGRQPCGLAAASAALLAITLALFFALVQPANAITDSWTVIPPNWVELRAHWEYGHALNAVLTFLAFCATTFSAVTHPDASAQQGEVWRDEDDGPLGSPYSEPRPWPR
ncbi:MAG: DUF1772 domain-containing protein [Alphaproteobacteria bacterium]|nr:DUF1772 domain-containing protein [Alphaproteobacteria bacterium]